MKAPDRCWGRFQIVGDGWAFTPHPDVGVVWQGGGNEAVVEYVRADRLATVEAMADDLAAERDRLLDQIERLKREVSAEGAMPSPTAQCAWCQCAIPIADLKYPPERLRPLVGDRPVCRDHEACEARVQNR